VTIGWGIVGTNDVARSMAHAILRRPGHAIVSVVSGASSNAVRFAEDFGGAPSASLEAMLQLSQVRCVYIASPTALHADHALAAIEAGKSVLIEKPFAASAIEARRVADAARAARVFCMEATWTRFLPVIGAAKRVLDGALGAVRQFEASFCQPQARDAARSVFDPAKAGGALLHRGFYGVSLARHFLGPVVSVHALARTGPTGVDEDSGVMMQHASGALAIVRSSLMTSARVPMRIEAESGAIHIEPPIFRPEGARMFRYAAPPIGGGSGGGGGGLRERPFAHALRQAFGPAVRRLRPGGRVIAAPYRGTGYDHQVEAVEFALSNGLLEHPLMPLNETLEVMDILDQARHDASGSR
jgi:predicted dehydrogenase